LILDFKAHCYKLQAEIEADNSKYFYELSQHIASGQKIQNIETPKHHTSHHILSMSTVYFARVQHTEMQECIR
jgi:hypothetical protein